MLTLGIHPAAHAAFLITMIADNVHYRRFHKVFGEHAQGVAMRYIVTRAPHLNARGRPKAWVNRLRSRRRTGSGRIGAGVGKP